jgi:lipopolysaccharide cholinephosphotransferase
MSKDEVLNKAIQNKLLEILNDVVELIEKNGLKYSLKAGTALGAIRHRGFIPWDDDVDIVLPREDYDKLIKILLKQPFAKYIFQNVRTNKNFNQCFSKIIDPNTTYISEDNINQNVAMGIFIDIFPLDYLTKSKFNNFIILKASELNILISRRKIYKEGTKIVKIISFLLLLIPKFITKYIRIMLENVIVQFGKNNRVYTAELTSTKKILNYRYPKDLFSNLIKVAFANQEFYIFKKYDDYLKEKYGNYMELPPKEQRLLKHKPIAIDLEKSYKYYISKFRKEGKVKK